MSHSLGCVVVDGKVLGFIEWNGTGDILADRNIRKTPAEVYNHWRGNRDNWECTCPDGQLHVKGTIHPYVDCMRVAHACVVCTGCMAVVSYGEDNVKSPWLTEIAV